MLEAASFSMASRTLGDQRNTGGQTASVEIRLKGAQDNSEAFKAGAITTAV